MISIDGTVRMDVAVFEKLILAEIAELEDLSQSSKSGRDPVILDQQSVACHAWMRCNSNQWIWHVNKGGNSVLAFWRRPCSALKRMIMDIVCDAMSRSKMRA